MNSRFMIMLVIALLLAGGAAYIANKWVEDQTSKDAKAGLNTVPVVVASTKIPFGTRLEATQVKLLKWPKDNVPKGALKEIPPMIGKITKRSFVADEIILKSQIREHLGGSILSALITPGMRAMSVRVNVAVGVAGFILPGNKVDIIATEGNNHVYTLLKNMKILAVDRIASPDREKPHVARTFTLEVTPKQAEILVQAMRKGGLRFTLINPIDARDIDPDAEVESEPEPKKGAKPIKPIPKEEPSVIIIPWTSNKEKECKGSVC